MQVLVSIQGNTTCTQLLGAALIFILQVRHAPHTHKKQEGGIYWQDECTATSTPECFKI